MKKSKNVEKRQTMNFYIRKELIPVFYEFTELIKKDPSIYKQRSKHNHSLMSIAIMMLITGYVKKRLEATDSISTLAEIEQIEDEQSEQAEEDDEQPEE